jgi:maleylacetoacetate isomerase
MPVKLFGFWRSLAAYRVRIALNLKGVEREDIYINLLKGEQFSDEYKKINPQMVVPALVDGELTLTQSMAILEYLDEKYSEPALLPKDSEGRARVRSISLISVADTHPLVVPRIRRYIMQDMGQSEDVLNAWLKHWQVVGLEALEAAVANNPATGTFAHGDSVSLADLCIVPQFGAAGMFGVDTKPYPTLKRIYDACATMDAFAREHPSKQPDFEPH